MNRKKLALVFLGFVLTFQALAQRGTITQIVPLGTMSRSQVAMLVGFVGSEYRNEIKTVHDVAFFKIIYTTIDWQGNPTRASGLICMPVKAEGVLPLFSFQHGTVVEKSFVPSRKKTGSGYEIGAVFASEGYVVSLADYLGLGDGIGMHPFFHAASEASACLDMLRATRNFCKLRKTELHDRIFLAGYSQGAHATMALQKEIESKHSREFSVAGTAVFGTPFDVSETQLDLMLKPKPYKMPGYLPYLLYSYQMIYKIFPSTKSIFRPEYQAKLSPFFQPSMPFSFVELNKVFKSQVPLEVLRPEVIKAVLKNPQHPLRQALSQNDVYKWRPLSPLRMFHCAGDQYVPAKSSKKAFDEFRKRNAKDISLIDPLPAADHGECLIPSMIQSRNWFDSLRHTPQFEVRKNPPAQAYRKSHK